MKIKTNSGTSSALLLLLIGAAFFALVSVLSHTRVHSLSVTCLYISVSIAFLAQIKLVNAVAHVFPKPVQSLIHWIHAMVFEMLTVFLVKPWMHFFRHSKTIPSKRAIFLVHGYCDDSGVWFFLRRALKPFGSVHTINLGHRFRSIEEYAEKLIAQMEQFPEVTEFVLIGHSMGGLVCSLAAHKRTDVTDVITIGSPLAGTHLAKIALGPNGKQMKRGSPFLEDLNKKMREQTKVRYYHIGTKTDQLVIPSSSSLRGVDPSREFFFDDIGHVSLLFSSRVRELLKNYLERSSQL